MQGSKELAARRTATARNKNKSGELKLSAAILREQCRGNEARATFQINPINI